MIELITVAVLAVTVHNPKPPFSVRHPHIYKYSKPVRFAAHKTNQGLLWTAKKVEPYQPLLNAGAAVGQMSIPAVLPLRR